MIERICIILAANLIFFFKTLGYKYCSDDIPAFKNPATARNKWEKLFFQLEGRIRVDMKQDHALTTLIHALTAVFIYLGFGADNVSFLAAMLFSFNPANNQGSVWIAGRAYALSALGMTMALAIPYLAPVLLLGITYFNSGFIAPLVFIGSSNPWILTFLPFAWLVHWQRFKTNVAGKVKQELFEEDRKIHWRKLVLVTKTLGFYFVHSLIPIKTTFYHSFLQSAAGCGKDKAFTMKDRFFWIGVLVITGIVAYWIYAPWTFISLGLLWWLITIAPFLNLVRIHQEIAERYMYLPNCGLMYTLAACLASHPAIAAFFLGMYATKMWFYMDAYQDDYYLVEQSCLNSPSSWFAWHVRAMKRWDARSYTEAVTLWVMARMISPKEFKLNFNLAAALILSNRHKEANDFLAIAEANVPGGQEKASKELIDNFRKGNITILL